MVLRSVRRICRDLEVAGHEAGVKKAMSPKVEHSKVVSPKAEQLQGGTWLPCFLLFANTLSSTLDLRVPGVVGEWFFA